MAAGPFLGGCWCRHFLCPPNLRIGTSKSSPPRIDFDITTAAIGLQIKAFHDCVWRWSGCVLESRKSQGTTLAEASRGTGPPRGSGRTYKAAELAKIL